MCAKTDLTIPERRRRERRYFQGKTLKNSATGIGVLVLQWRRGYFGLG